MGMNAGTKIAQEIFRLRNADAERAAAQKQEERILATLSVYKVNGCSFQTESKR
jgi:hypothetical protein